jgi:hypothetical protein
MIASPERVSGFVASTQNRLDLAMSDIPRSHSSARSDSRYLGWPVRG